jgi:diaminopropionate ammonia-lyase family
MSSSRRPIYFNSAAIKASCPAVNSQGVDDFHRSLPTYSPTPLIALQDLASELGVRGIYVKDESSRFGLPSFKILGASWGVFRALSKQLSIPSEVTLSELSAAARTIPIRLFAATDGNHGRAVAFMAKILSLQAHIFVPETLDEYTRGRIASEGAIIHPVSGDYDITVQEAAEMANATYGGLLVQDTSFAGYEEIPSWIVEGYSTMLLEIDQQLAKLGLHSTILITPVGVGSLAHAVVRHCKTGSRSVHVVTVEPDTAACLHQSLKAGSPVSLGTSRTIMSGMDCGTVSPSAWNDLQNLVDASTTISCFESHCAVQYLSSHGIASGPCGAASLAALKLLASTKQGTLKLDEKAVVVLLSTEGVRPYQMPMDVSSDDPTTLTKVLDTINPLDGGPSNIRKADKKDIANYIMAWLEHRGIEHHLETVSGCPSSVMAVDASGREKPLILTSQCDTGGQNVNASLATGMVSLLTARAY